MAAQLVLSGLSYALDACVGQEVAWPDPVSREIQVVDAWHTRTRSTGEATADGRRQRSNGEYVRQEDAPDDAPAPAWVRGVKQLFELVFVLARVGRVARIELFECVHHCGPRGCNARVHRRSAEEQVVLAQGSPITAIVLQVCDERLQSIQLIANPDKLRAVAMGIWQKMADASAQCLAY